MNAIAFKDVSGIMIGSEGTDVLYLVVIITQDVPPMELQGMKGVVYKSGSQWYAEKAGQVIIADSQGSDIIPEDFRNGVNMPKISLCVVMPAEILG